MAGHYDATRMQNLLLDATKEERAVDEPDYQNIFNICDLLNTRPQAPKDLADIVKKRLSAKKVSDKEKLLTMIVLDSCVKNTSGEFHKEINESKFLAVLCKLVERRKPKKGMHRLDSSENLYRDLLEEKVLVTIESWAQEFKQMQQRFPNIIATYESLLADGIDFPPQSGEDLAPIFTPQENAALQLDKADSTLVEEVKELSALTVEMIGASDEGADLSQDPMISQLVESMRQKDKAMQRLVEELTSAGNETALNSILYIHSKLLKAINMYEVRVNPEVEEMPEPEEVDFLGLGSSSGNSSNSGNTTTSTTNSSHASANNDFFSMLSGGSSSNNSGGTTTTTAISGNVGSDGNDDDDEEGGLIDSRNTEQAQPGTPKLVVEQTDSARGANTGSRIDSSFLDQPRSGSRGRRGRGRSPSGGSTGGLSAGRRSSRSRSPRRRGRPGSTGSRENSASPEADKRSSSPSQALFDVFGGSDNNNNNNNNTNTNDDDDGFDDFFNERSRSVGGSTVSPSNNKSPRASPQRNKRSSPLGYFGDQPLTLGGGSDNNTSTSAGSGNGLEGLVLGGGGGMTTSAPAQQSQTKGSDDPYAVFDNVRAQHRSRSRSRSRSPNRTRDNTNPFGNTSGQQQQQTNNNPFNPFAQSNNNQNNNNGTSDNASKADPFADLLK